jgi:hypothetical protein
MSVKHIRPFLILGVAGVLIAACGGEQQVDTGAERPAPAVEAPPVAAFPEGWPLTADGAIRRELAKLEAEHAADRKANATFPEGWPLTADGAIRRELAKLEAEHAAD